MSIEKGGDLMLYVVNGQTKRSIAFATSHSLSVNAEMVDISHKDIAGGWKANKARKLSWSLTTENLFCWNDTETAVNTYEELVDAMIAKTKLNVVFAKKDTSDTLATVFADGWDYSTATGETDKYYGTVIIESIELNAPNGDNATYTCNLKGVGALNVGASPTFN